LPQNSEQLLDDFSRRRSLCSAAIRRAHQECFAERSREPMGLAPAGQLIDGHATIFLPAAGSGDRRGVRRISGQCISQLMPAADQTIKVGQVSLDLSLEAFFHRSLLALLPKSRRARPQKPGWARILGFLTVRGESDKVPPASGSITGPVYNISLPLAVRSYAGKSVHEVEPR